LPLVGGLVTPLVGVLVTPLVGGFFLGVLSWGDNYGFIDCF